MTQEQLMEQAEFVRDQQREDGVFTGRWISSCCGSLMDYTMGFCPECLENAEPKTEVEEVLTPEQLLTILDKELADMKSKGVA